MIGAVPVSPCLNSSWIMGLRIYGEEKTRIPLISPALIGPLPRTQIRQILIYTDINIASNTNINQIRVTFTNYCNTISIDRLPSKTKTEKYSWYFNNSLLCKTEVSSATKTFLFLLKTQKNKYSCSGPPTIKKGSCRLSFS